MITPKNLFIAFSLSSLVIFSMQGKSIFEQMEEEMFESMQRMHEQMEECFSHIRQMHGSSSSATKHRNYATLIINEVKDGVELSVTPLKSAKDSLEATISFDENLITVPTAQGTLKVHIRQHPNNRPYVAAQFYHQEKKEASKEQSHSSAMNYNSQMASTVNHDLDIAKTSIKYVEESNDNGKLVVHIPYKEKSVTKIQVQIEKQHSKTEK